MNKPNVIMILLDGCRTDRIKNMNNFQKLAMEGTLFSKMITYAPYTIASMHAIFSGTYGHRNGTDNYYGTPTFRKEIFGTIATYLKKEGYVTIGDILNSLVIPKEGFDDLKVHDEYNDNLTERHGGLLKEVAKLNKEKKKCFLFLHYSNIHTNIKINVSKKYTNFSKEYFDQKEENSKAYDSYVKKADDYVGNISELIKSLGLDKNSILLFHSDHGISIGEKFGEKTYGAFCYDYTLRAFAMFHYPENFPKVEIPQLVRTVDILPTILDILKIKQAKSSEKIDGISMIPLLQGKKDKREAYSESGNPNFSDPPKPPQSPNCRAYRTEKWKFIHNYWDHSEELYDLENDPSELKNILKGNKRIANILRNKLNKELRRALDMKIKKIKSKKPQ